jgi:hypothetical protein
VYFLPSPSTKLSSLVLIQYAGVSTFLLYSVSLYDGYHSTQPLLGLAFTKIAKYGYQLFVIDSYLIIVCMWQGIVTNIDRYSSYIHNAAICTSAVLTMALTLPLLYHSFPLSPPCACMTPSLPHPKGSL